jgi:hypothetical protein
MRTGSYEDRTPPYVPRTPIVVFLGQLGKVPDRFSMELVRVAYPDAINLVLPPTQMQ